MSDAIPTMSLSSRKRASPARDEGLLLAKLNAYKLLDPRFHVSGADYEKYDVFVGNDSFSIPPAALAASQGRISSRPFDKSDL